MVDSTTFTPPQPRIPGIFNWYGLWVLTLKEVQRFTKILSQTVVAPLMSTLLFYLVFDIALGGGQRTIGEVPYMTFLAPGLVIMSMAQNAFTGVSSSLVISKVQGNIVDVLMAPLSPLEFVLGYMFGGVARGLAVGAVSVLAIVFVAGLGMPHPFYALYYAVSGSMMLGLMGLIGGIWANRFDHLAVVQNFIIAPATFLSGTFYSADHLPPIWRAVCYSNPFFYMIDGFRYGFTGAPDGMVNIGIAVLAASNLILLFLAWRMVASGYKLKS